MLIYHAKNIIVSYGGPCTNRYFCNPNSTVIVYVIYISLNMM